MKRYVLVTLALISTGVVRADEQKGKARFTIGRDTTYVLGPVDKEGLVDFEDALNELMSKGVTPENNANVLLWRAFGPHPEGSTMPPEFFKWLRIDSPPEQGEYFIPMYKYARDVLNIPAGPGMDKILDEMMRASKRPWGPGVYPGIAAWITANAKPLAVVHEAVKRTHYFNPLTSRRQANGAPGGLIGALLPAVQKCRELANILTARAMMHLATGQADAAWADLIACHRLARHVSRGGTLIEVLVGVAIDAIATQADITFLEHASFDARKLAGYRKDLDSLQPLSIMAEKMNLCERFMFLETVMMIERHGLRYLEGLAGAAVAQNTEEQVKFMKVINWDPALRSANQWYNRLGAAGRLESRADREKALNKIDDELKELKVKAKDDIEKVTQQKDMTPEAKGRAIADVMVCMLLPAVRKVQLAGDRAIQNQRNLAIAFALAAYRLEHFSYPKDLAALTPKYLAAIPLDYFSGKAMIYKPGVNGYVLYSVGPNGVDDDGRWHDDTPPGDDPRVRLPQPAPK